MKIISSKDFVKDFVKGFVKGFVKDFVRGFVKDFVRGFVKDFVKCFVKDFAKSFVKDFVRGIVQDFVILEPKITLSWPQDGSRGPKMAPLTLSSPLLKPCIFCWTGIEFPFINKSPAQRSLGEAQDGPRLLQDSPKLLNPKPHWGRSRKSYQQKNIIKN